MDLLTKYRPKDLDQILGQDEVIDSLKLWLREPYSCPMLFHGESGTGKTSAALALASSLGVDLRERELGGLHEIASGEQTGESVRQALDGLRFRPLFGSGWKALIVNEADRMTTAAETIWLDGLEHLPARAVVIFTTNQPERISKRLRDRCEVYRFESDPEKLRPAIKRLAQQVWKAEIGRGTCPGIDQLGMPTLGALDSMMGASFRLALHQLTRYVREARLGQGNLGKVKKQLARDLLVTKGTMTCACDHCGHEQNVRKGAESHRCEKCRKRFALEWED